MNILGEFFHHNSIMNLRLIDACAELDPDQLAASVAGTYGTIGATLVHISNAQDSYTARFFNDAKLEALPEAPFPGIAAVRDRVRASNARLEEAAAIGADGRTIEVSGDDPAGTWTMPGSLLLVQAVNHATEHRSQVATILTQLGVEPPDMSGWAFFFDVGHMSDSG